MVWMCEGRVGRKNKLLLKVPNLKGMKRGKEASA